MKTNPQLRPGLVSSAANAGTTVFAREDNYAPGSAHVWEQPEIVFYRRMLDRVVRTMADGQQIPFWVFEDPLAPRLDAEIAASPIIRLQEHQRAHIRLETSPRIRYGAVDATVAGLETDASPASDCFTYQWQPSASGTWFYQSHASRPVDFEMGLYGVTVVEPSRTEDEPKRAYTRGPAYDIERILVLDDVDPVWHAEALDGARSEERFQTFNPRYFLINDVPNTQVRYHPNVAIEARRGQSLLLRLMNASFSVVTVSIAGLKSHIVSVDGHPVASSDRPWAKWIPVMGGQGVYLATASRHDVLLDLDHVEAGEYEITIEFQDSKRRVRNANASHPAHVGRAVTTIRIK